MKKTSKVKMGYYTMYTAKRYCDEFGLSESELTFNGFKPMVVLASDVDECPYCCVRCDELNKPYVCENGDIIEDTPHWFVIGGHTDYEIPSEEVFDWLQKT